MGTTDGDCDISVDWIKRYENGKKTYFGRIELMFPHDFDLLKEDE